MNVERRPTFSTIDKQGSRRLPQLGYLLNALISEKRPDERRRFRLFAGNSSIEAVHGAIKIARHRGRMTDRVPNCLVLDSRPTLRRFFSPVEGAPLVPGVLIVRTLPEVRHVSRDRAYSLVLFRPASTEEVLEIERSGIIDTFRALNAPVALDLDALGPIDEVRPLLRLRADIYLFGEQLTERQIPLGVFLTRSDLYSPWANEYDARLHSSTFGGNDCSVGYAVETILRRCKLPALVREEVDRIAADARAAQRARELYLNPALARIAAHEQGDLNFARAEGIRVVLEDGRHVVDCCGGSGVNIRGHNPDDVVKALDAYEPGSSPWRDLERELCREANLARAFPAVSGATANDIAFLLAMAASHPRRKVIVFKSNYAGKTLTQLPFSRSSWFQDPFKPLFDEIIEIDPGSPRAAADLTAALHRDDVALVWLCLVMYGDILDFPDALLEVIQNEKRPETYVLVDEVFTGMYRVGELFAHRGRIAPDLVTMAKGLSDCTFPIGVTLASDRVVQAATGADADLVKELGEHYRNELGSLIALNVLRWANERDLGSRVKRTMEVFQRRLRELEARHEGVSVRGTGMVGFVHMQWGPSGPVDHLLREGLLADQGHELLPPLNIELGELDEVFAALERVAKKRAPLRDPLLATLRLKAWTVRRKIHSVLVRPRVWERVVNRIAPW